MAYTFGAERKKKLPDVNLSGVHRKLRICGLYRTSPEIRFLVITPRKKVHLLGLNLLIIISLLTRNALIIVLLNQPTVHIRNFPFFLDNNKAIHQVSSPTTPLPLYPYPLLQEGSKRGNKRLSFVCQMRALYWLDDSLEKRRLRCIQEPLGRQLSNRSSRRAVVTSLNKSRERKKRRQL